MLASLRETVTGEEFHGVYKLKNRGTAAAALAALAAATDGGDARRRVLFPQLGADRRKLALALLPPENSTAEDGMTSGDGAAGDQEDEDDEDEDEDDDDEDSDPTPLWAQPLQEDDPGNLRAAADLYALYDDANSNKRCRTAFEMFVSLLVSGRKNTILYYKKRDMGADVFPPVCEHVRGVPADAPCHRM